jgi:hypothetical protein
LAIVSPRVQQEQVNDRAKLAMHRLIARRILRQPEMVSRAVQVMAKLRLEGRDEPYYQEWRALLDRHGTGATAPITALVRQLSSRSERMNRLRSSSPFMLIEELDLADVALRRRIWRMAKRAVARRQERTADGSALPSSP